MAFKNLPELPAIPKYLTALILILVLIGGFEIALREIPEGYNRGVIRYDSDLVWTFSRDESIPFKGHFVKTNNLGFRDQKIEDRPEEQLEIAFLGDSYTTAVRLEERQRFTEKMERKLEEKNISAEVYNFGIVAYGTGQEVIVFEENVKKIDPDIVFLMVAPNDIRASYKKKLFRLRDGQARIYRDNKAFNISPVDRAAWWLADHSALFFRAQKLFGLNYGTPERIFEETIRGAFFNNTYGFGEDEILFRKNETGEMENAVKLWKSLIYRLKNQKSSETRLVLVSLPIEKQFTSIPRKDSLEVRKIDRIINSTSKELELPNMQFYTRMNNSDSPEKFFLENDPHYNSKAHSMIAEELTRFLEERNMTENYTRY